jgi:hypothetical protein
MSAFGAIPLCGTFYFPHLKLSITHPDLHFIACLRDLGHNTAIIFPRHHGIAARQNCIWIQRSEPALNPQDLRGLQLDVMEQRGMCTARQLVYALALGLDSTLWRNVSKLRDQGSECSFLFGKKF